MKEVRIWHDIGPVDDISEHRELYLSRLAENRIGDPGIGVDGTSMYLTLNTLAYFCL